MNAHDVQSAAIRVAPPIAAVASGLTLNHLVAVLTAIYLVAQLAYLWWKWRREARAKGPSE